MSNTEKAYLVIPELHVGLLGLHDSLHAGKLSVPRRIVERRVTLLVLQIGIQACAEKRNAGVAQAWIPI